VWASLIRNALQSMPETGTLRVFIGATEKRILVRVSDSGPGLPPDRLDGIFDAAFPGWASFEEGYVSLHFARNLVEGFGGSLRLDSNGGGTVFAVELPVFGAPGTESR
jgi:signal transduction histidine kinase